MKRIFICALALIASVGFLIADSTTMKPPRHKTTSGTIKPHHKSKKGSKGKKSDPNSNTGTTPPKVH